MEKIYYCDIETPMGDVWSAASGKGLLRLNLPCKETTFLGELGRQIDVEPEYRPGKLDEVSLWLDDYFKGEKATYTEAFDMRGTPAVGNAVGQNPISIVIPCHRVVWSNGGIGGFGGGLDRKRFLLNVEGVLPSADDRSEKGIDLSQYFYNR